MSILTKLFQNIILSLFSVRSIISKNQIMMFSINYSYAYGF